jgi:hypothetical protein
MDDKPTTSDRLDELEKKFDLVLRTLISNGNLHTAGEDALAELVPDVKADREKRAAARAAAVAEE